MRNYFYSIGSSANRNRIHNKLIAICELPTVCNEKKMIKNMQSLSSKISFQNWAQTLNLAPTHFVLFLEFKWQLVINLIDRELQVVWKIIAIRDSNTADENGLELKTQKFLYLKISFQIICSRKTDPISCVRFVAFHALIYFWFIIAFCSNGSSHWLQIEKIWWQR